MDMGIAKHHERILAQLHLIENLHRLFLAPRDKLWYLLVKLFFPILFSLWRRRMAGTPLKKLSYVQKVFYFTHSIGILAGLIFPFAVAPLIGPVATSLPFIFSTMVMGFGVGAAMFFFVRITLKKQLQEQLRIMQPLTGVVRTEEGSVETLTMAVETSVTQVENFIRELLLTVDEFVPLYRSLAEGSRYLSDRAQDGLAAAIKTRKDVELMESKQQEVMQLIERLSERSQDEASISRELSASLEEMASAMDHSTAQFLETTSSVNELASSVVEVSSQATEIARAVEGTAQDMDATGDALQKIRSGAQESAQTAEAVKKDAENGLNVVQRAIDEMSLIEDESQKAMAAMERLSGQTKEVAKIIEVIRELVSDTELLAFNAAIIAAKAGEEGKGFSVVAEEIRDLADRTTTSAQDIQKIVQNIGGETREVTTAVAATGQKIEKGKQLSLSAGEALGKIVASANAAVVASEGIVQITGVQGERARTLIDDAGQSLRSVKAIARAIQEQQSAITRIQEGVTQMKGASDQIARGMEEQVQANREFNRGLAERETQVLAIEQATSLQQATAQEVFSHFGVSEQRLRKNAERAKATLEIISSLETLADQLRDQAQNFKN
jgi:methyl-accepting chemotaxis protein